MQKLSCGGRRISVESLDTVVIGSGCAGFNAADTLWSLGRTNIALLTEGIRMGTSRNTGSDKQTYYKLSLCSDSVDSVYALAQDLFQGGSVNGDTALAEAAGSVRSFMKLVNLGVPFPTNRYGEYVGYRTDHDSRRRATSCGPLTSKIMTEKLENAVKQKQIPIYDHMQAIRLFTMDGMVKGVFAIDLDRMGEEDRGLTLFLCNHVILATGGPAIVYDASVYPESQTGMTGLALEAGAAACNLQEWQYGLASIKFRWNVSGTYQQALPRYLSIDRQGSQREFLLDYFKNPCHALDMVFLKGYQWPFDTEKINGSSLIDLLVYHEVCIKGNRVFLDFRQDPAGLESGFEGLEYETKEYLERSGALLRTPIARLEQMNPGAAALYAAHGIDLHQELLEIAVCAQHHNGGIAVDLNWQTSVKGLYAAGEAAGTFGVSRPGGSALNAAQVGSQRAAEHIACAAEKPLPPLMLEPEAVRMVKQIWREMDLLCGAPVGEKVLLQRKRMQRAMSFAAAQIRDLHSMKALQEQIVQKRKHFFDETRADTPAELSLAYKNRDMLLTQEAILSAMLLTGEACGSRGSALLADEKGISISVPGLHTGTEINQYRYLPGNGTHRADWTKTVCTPEGCASTFEKVRPLPKTDDWFETVWKEYNKRHQFNK